MFPKEVNNFPVLFPFRQYHLNNSTTSTTTDVHMDMYCGLPVDFSSFNLPRNGDFSQVSFVMFVHVGSMFLLYICLCSVRFICCLCFALFFMLIRLNGVCPSLDTQPAQCIFQHLVWFLQGQALATAINVSTVTNEQFVSYLSYKCFLKSLKCFSQ